MAVMLVWLELEIDKGLTEEAAEAIQNIGRDHIYLKRTAACHQMVSNCNTSSYFKVSHGRIP